MNAKQRKNEGDRLRRERIKLSNMANNASSATSSSKSSKKGRAKNVNVSTTDYGGGGYGISPPPNVNVMMQHPHMTGSAAVTGEYAHAQAGGYGGVPYPGAVAEHVGVGHGYGHHVATPYGVLPPLHGGHAHAPPIPPTGTEPNAPTTTTSTSTSGAGAGPNSSSTSSSHVQQQRHPDGSISISIFGSGSDGNNNNVVSNDGAAYGSSNAVVDASTMFNSGEELTTGNVKQEQSQAQPGDDDDQHSNLPGNISGV
mmetsp:Transcript_23/g.37  ORF Transcript_23/g.37 Transcript_23/m.37 type:complete len:255 (-) Transcript_23:475-1239(-)